MDCLLRSSDPGHQFQYAIEEHLLAAPGPRSEFPVM